MDDATLQQLAALHGRSGIAEHWRQRYADADGRLWQWRRGACAHCEGSGYHGRLGVHELLLADDALRELVRHRAPMRELVTLSQSRGMATLRQDGIDKVLQGLTDLPEVLAATQP
ncbi:type II secretion system protein E [mine drainage metagenome]|uniref:Type II secretion system protein E n=1 Tax=mine drainage metagenome TaxID=410659 RepID=A0A1J5QAJ1_9ZZZZ